MRRLAILLIPAARVLGACGSKSSDSTASSSQPPAAPPSSAAAKPAAKGPTTTKPRAPGCEAADKLGYDFLIVQKAKTASQTEKSQIAVSVQKHAAELKTQVPQLAGVVDSLVAYQTAWVGGGTVPKDISDKNDQAQKDLQAWYKTTCK